MNGVWGNRKKEKFILVDFELTFIMSLVNRMALIEGHSEQNYVGKCIYKHRKKVLFNNIRVIRWASLTGFQN